MMPDYPLGETLDFKFSTRQFSTGAPFLLAGSPAAEVYEDNDITQITVGITVTANFDGKAGLNNVRVVATGGNGYEAGKSYAVVISAGTIDSVSVVGEVIAQFSIERSPALRPTVAGRTLDVLATGEVPIDFDTSIGTLGATSIEVNALDGKGDWNIGKSGYALTVADWNVGKTGYSIAVGGIAATAFAAGAIDAAALNTTAVDEIADGVVDELLAPHVTVDSLAVHLKDILADVTGIAGAAMRGTDGANTVVPLTAAQTESEVNDALVAIHLDHLFSVDYDPAAKPGVATALLNELVESDAGVSRFTANALEQTIQTVMSEVTSVPAATPTVAQALMWAYQSSRNKRDTTAASDEVHTSAGAVVAAAVVSDDTVTFTKAKYA